MPSVLTKGLSLLDAGERRRGAYVLVLMIATAFFEALGVASVLPFLRALSDQSAIEQDRLLSWSYDALGAPPIDRFLFLLGGAAFALILASAAVRSANLYALHRYVYMRKHSIGARLLDTYLRQPYAFHVQRNTGDLAKSILSEVDVVVREFFLPCAMFVSQGLVLLALVALLVAIDPLLAFAVAIVLGGVYGAIYLAVRPFVARLGRLRAHANRKRFEIASEALGGIKDIKVLCQEKTYSERFVDASRRNSEHQAAVETMSLVPKFGIEAIGFGGIILLTLVMMARADGARGDALEGVLPLLGIYAFAGYKMLPALQGIYRSLAQLRFGAAAVDGLYCELRADPELPVLEGRPREPLPLGGGLSLERVSFAYTERSVPVLQNVSLAVPAGSTVGIVGTTGSGKTTLIDLILGLLEPSAGRLVVGGVEITQKNLRAWQANIGYVPQTIFLADASIAENIALGVAAEGIDRERVAECARMARIHDFVESLPDGYETSTGERGVRLSGGQRQRIGIARALYHDPALVVFDEATSALDNVTEREVMAAIERLAGRTTVIMVAHRLSTVQRCDKIIILDKGRIAAEGSFATLSDSSGHFKQLSQAAYADDVAV